MTSNEIQQNHAVPGISIPGMDTSMEQLNHPINYFNPFQQNYQNPYSQQFTNSFFQMPYNQNLNQTIDNSEIKDEILDDKESKEEGNLENIQPIQNPLHLKSEQNIGLYHQNPNLFPTYDFGNGYPAQNNFYPNFNYFNSMGNQIPPFWNNTCSSPLNNGQQSGNLPQYEQYNYIANLQPEFEETIKQEEPNVLSNLETSDLGSSMNVTSELNVTSEFSDHSSNELDQALNLSIKDEELDQVLDLSIKYDFDENINISNNINFPNEDTFNQETPENHSETVNEETQINHSETQVKTKNSELNDVRRYSDWVKDETLPSGWKKRYYEKRSNRSEKPKKVYQYLSESNEIFSSRSKIVAYMQNCKTYSEDTIQKVLSGKQNNHITNQGGVVPWEEDDLLPRGWKRKYAHHHHQFLSPENKRFQSVLSTINFIKQSEKYSEQDADKILEVGKIQSLKLTQNQTLHGVGFCRKMISDWETDDSMPKGWKRRYANKHHLFVSPENKRFQSLKSAIMFMKASNYSEEDIEKLVKVCQIQSEKLTNNKNIQFLGKL